MILKEIWFVVILLLLVTGCTLIWCGVREVAIRWLNNDWCRHEWDMWSSVDKENPHQFRFCKKCNKYERRTP